MIHKRMVITVGVMIFLTIALVGFLTPQDHSKNADVSILNDEGYAISENNIGEAFKHLTQSRFRYMGCSKDGGKNVDVQDSLTVKYSIRGQVKMRTYTDECNAGYLKEYYCDGRRMMVDNFKCRHGCYEGACR